jgi:hypothetical protein
MTTRLLIKDEIDQEKLDILLSMIKSWNLEAEVQPIGYRPEPIVEGQDIFADVYGIWADYDIDAKKLREKAWERHLETDWGAHRLHG